MALLLRPLPLCLGSGCWFQRPAPSFTRLYILPLPDAFPFACYAPDCVVPDTIVLGRYYHTFAVFTVDLLTVITVPRTPHGLLTLLLLFYLPRCAGWRYICVHSPISFLDDNLCFVCVFRCDWFGLIMAYYTNTLLPVDSYRMDANPCLTHDILFTVTTFAARPDTPPLY